MQLGSSIRNGTLWLFAGNFSRRALEFAVGVILARLLLPSDFGLLVSIQIFTGIAGLFSGGGMGNALVQAKEVSTKHYHVIFTIQLIICTLIYCVFFFSSPWIAHWLNNPIYIELLRFSALNFLFRPFQNIAISKLAREMRFKSISVIDLFSLVVTSASSIFLAWHHFGVWSLVYSGLLASVIATICYVYHSACYPKIAFDKAITKELGPYGFKFAIKLNIYYIKDQLPNLLMSKFLGANTVGLFNKGDSLSTYPVTMIAGSAYQTVFRALSIAQDNIDQSKYIYLRTITLITVYTCPFYIGLFWLAEPFIVTIYGEKWQLAAIPLQIFCISQLFACIGTTAGAVMDAQNILGVEIKIQLIALLLTAGGCWYGIQHNDITAIAYGLLISPIFLHLSLSFFAIRALNATFKEMLTALKPAILLNTILAVVLKSTDFILELQTINHLSPRVYLAILSIVGGLFYALCFLYLPIKLLETETTRWKKMLRLSRN